MEQGVGEPVAMPVKPYSREGGEDSARLVLRLMGVVGVASVGCI